MRVLRNAGRGLTFGLTKRALVAFNARAFRAGERLVAGFRRVDLPATTRLRGDDVADECREVERDVSFFTLFAVAPLMREALISKDDRSKSPEKSRRSLA